MGMGPRSWPPPGIATAGTRSGAVVLAQTQGQNVPGGRTSFEIMPVDGPRDPRSTSRIINGAMTGKLNSVVDFTIPVNGLPFTLEDQRISPQSYIQLMPLNFAAATGVVYVTPGDQQAVIDQGSAEYRVAVAQVGEDGGSVTLNGVTWTAIPYNIVDYDANWIVHPADPGSVDNRIISNITGNVACWFAVNGVASNNNPVIECGVAHYNSADVLQSRAAILFSGSGNANVFDMSAYFIFSNDVQPGDYFQLEGLYAGSLDPYSANWGLDNITGGRSARINEDLPMEYRALIIG